MRRSPHPHGWRGIRLSSRAGWRWANRSNSAGSGSTLTWCATNSTQAREMVVVLLRRPLIGGDLPDPGADLADGLGHAVATHGQECEVDVLAVPKCAIGADDALKDRSQFRIGDAVRGGGGAVVVGMGHQETSCRAVMTAWYPATCRVDSSASALRSRSATA